MSTSIERRNVARWSNDFDQYSTSPCMYIEHYGAALEICRYRLLYGQYGIWLWHSKYTDGIDNDNMVNKNYENRKVYGWYTFRY